MEDDIISETATKTPLDKEFAGKKILVNIYFNWNNIVIM